jgi:hypothetical protein
MSLKHQHDLRVKERSSFEQTPGNRKQGLSKNEPGSLSDITLEWILKKLFAGLQKQFIAVKFQFHRLTSGVFSQMRFPWFKIGFVLVVFFILAKKDIQFSVNMQAPLSGVINDERGEDERMSFVQPVTMKGASSSSIPSVQELDEERVASYVKRFSRVAISEMEKFGIPASIKMAQGILESWSGTHPQAKQSNNHFGSPLAGHNFNSAWENWRAHSELIRQHVQDFSSLGNDYHKWASVLSEMGYSKDPAYAEELVKVIQKFRLNQLDEL